MENTSGINRSILIGTNRFASLRSTPVYDSYWRFAAERQEIFFRRLEGRPHPWTKDEILQRYKFTNAYRASDRVSQFLIRNVIYGEKYSLDPTETVFRILLFKLFNKIETWQHLEAAFGLISLSASKTFDSDRYSDGGSALNKSSSGISGTSAVTDDELRSFKEVVKCNDLGTYNFVPTIKLEPSDLRLVRTEIRVKLRQVPGDHE